MEKPFLGAFARLVFTRPDNFREHCSGSFVSDGGAILTGAHCVETCAHRGACSIEVNDDVREYRILLTSRCDSAQFSSFFARVSADPAAVNSSLEPCATQTDLALLVPAIPFAPDRCLQMSSRTVAVGEAVATGGFPATTSRNSLAYGLRFAEGTRVHRDWCSVRSPAGAERSRVWLTDPPQVRGLSLSPHFMQTTVDVYVAASGGPLFDEGGLVVGVASYFINHGLADRQGESYLPAHTAAQECAGAEFYASLDALPGMASLAGVRAEVEKLTCREHRASR